jgi:hypothetical protein
MRAHAVPPPPPTPPGHGRVTALTQVRHAGPGRLVTEVTDRSMPRRRRPRRPACVRPPAPPPSRRHARHRPARPRPPAGPLPMAHPPAHAAAPDPQRRPPAPSRATVSAPPGFPPAWVSARCPHRWGWPLLRPLRLPRNIAIATTPRRYASEVAWNFALPSARLRRAPATTLLLETPVACQSVSSRSASCAPLVARHFRVGARRVREAPRGRARSGATSGATA